MADTRINVDDFEAGRLPEVCVLTGQTEGIGEFSLRVGNGSGAGNLLLLLGLVPWLIWRMTRRYAQGSLPVSRHGYERLTALRSQRRRRWLLWLAGFLAVAALALLLRYTIVDSNAPVMLALAGVIGFFVVLALPQGRWVPFGARLEPSGRWLQIRDVHPAFVAAVEAHRSRPAAAPQPPAAPVTQPPGWYPDPLDGSRRRYWDGARWTDSIA